MQVEHKTEKGTVVFVKVPEDSSNYRFEPWDGMGYGLTYDIYLGYRHFQQLEAEIHDWQLIGLTSEVTGEQARMLIGKKSYTMIDRYPNYLNDKSWCATALQSFKSIMQHLQVIESQKWVVLFKEN